jgi:hypothetical protein
MQWDKAEVIHKGENRITTAHNQTNPLALCTSLQHKRKINLALQMNMHKVSGSKSIPYINTAK